MSSFTCFRKISCCFFFLLYASPNVYSTLICVYTYTPMCVCACLRTCPRSGLKQKDKNDRYAHAVHRQTDRQKELLTEWKSIHGHVAACDTMLTMDLLAPGYFAHLSSEQPLALFDPPHTYRGHFFTWPPYVHKAFVLLLISPPASRYHPINNKYTFSIAIQSPLQSMRKGERTFREIEIKFLCVCLCLCLKIQSLSNLCYMRHLNKNEEWKDGQKKKTVKGEKMKVGKRKYVMRNV